MSVFKMNYFLSPMASTRTGSNGHYCLISIENLHILGCGTQVTRGFATGRAVFSVEEALDFTDQGVPVILVRINGFLYI